MRIDHAAKVDIPDQQVTPLGPPGQLVIGQGMILLAARVIELIDLQEVMRIGHAEIWIRVHQGQNLREIEQIVRRETPKTDRAAKLDIPDQEVTPLGLPGQPVIGQGMNVRGAMVTRGPLGLPIKDPPGQMVRSQ
jgi:hypothetical protein